MFFYTLYNLNEIHNTQKHIYNQIISVKKLKEKQSLSDVDVQLTKKLNYLQDKLKKTEDKRVKFIDTINLEFTIILFIAFIFSFIVLVKIIIKVQDTLQNLNKSVLQLFNNDEKTAKIDFGEKNELSEITDVLNSYLSKQGYIIHAREELLRNISHELKTPITKGKFLLENLKSKNNSAELINNVFLDLEELTNKLLEREKLNFVILNHTNFKISSLVLNALSKLPIENESKIVIDIIDDFTIKGDKYYLTLALKNLIDNALKFAKEYPITIYSSKKSIYITNIAEKLSKDFIYYIQPFTREANQQNGHGLGLNIVNKVITMHNFEFKYKYKYQDSKNIFFIKF